MIRRTRIFSWICTALLGFAAVSRAADHVLLDGLEVDANLVMARVKAADAGKLRALSVVDGEVANSSKLVPGLLELKRVKVGGLAALSDEQKAASLKQWIEDLKASGQFEYVEPNYILRFSAIPSDQAFASGALWGLNNFGQSGGVPGADISATNAWDFSVGSTNTIVAVVDSGVRYTHRDLAAQMWINEDEVPGNGVDDDNDGFTDNIYGADAANNDGDPNDDVGHGTHVAGTIGAAANDGNAHVGVAWRVRLMALKAGDDNGLPVAAIVRSIEFAAANGAKIINASFGGFGFSQAQFDAINAIRSRGVLFVAAAGNESNDNDVLPAYPASYQLDNIISVAAMDRRDLLAGFSNYGRRTVHLGAPGVEIYSTYNGSDTDYQFLQGTSMASPHVAGVAALVASFLPGASYAEIRSRLLENVTRVPILADRTITGGRVNAFRALTKGVDGIIEFSITPPSNSQISIGERTLISVSLSDGPPVTNATVNLTGGGTNLVLRYDASGTNATPSSTAGTYTNTLVTGNAAGTITYTLNASAPSKANLSAQVVYEAVNRPANDRFANALKVPLQATWTHITSNRLATIEGDAEAALAHGGVANAAASVWYSWSFPQATDVIVDTAGSTFDTVIGVYEGITLAGLQEVVRANDIGQRRDAWVKFRARAGVSYKIAVAGVPPDQEGSLLVRFEVNGEPDIVAPILLVTSPVSGITTQDKSIQIRGTSFDPQPNASGIADAGVQYTVSRTQVRNPNQLPRSAQGTTNWIAPVDLAEGINYVTIWAFDNAENRSIERQIAVVYRLPLSANDLFANRILLESATDIGLSRTDNSDAATREFREPAHAGNPGGKSVWYEFRPPDSGVLFLTTLGSSFDTLLAVYTSTNLVQPRVTTLQELASNDDVAGAGNHSEAIITVAAGEIYYIAVDGFDGVSGTVKLNYTFNAKPLRRLTILPSTGNGTVMPKSGAFPVNATVSIVARPAAGSQFEYFETPSGRVATNPLTVTMTQDIEVRAVFSTRTFAEDFEGGLALPFVGNKWSIEADPASPTNQVFMSLGGGAHRLANIVSLTARVVDGVGSFEYGVSTERTYDKLEFYITYLREGQPTNAALIGSWSGEARGRYEFGLEAGLAKLEWRYVKDRAISGGADRVFIDNLDLPLFTAELALSLKNKTVTLSVRDLAGQTVLIEASTDLQNWSAAGTASADEAGQISFQEPAGAARKFYRFKPQAPAQPQ